MKYRILKYPQTVEECHDLIKVLVAELNEYAEFVLSDYEEVSEDVKENTPFTSDKEISMSFNHPAGINGGSQSTAEGCGGMGVRFMNFEGRGVPFTTSKNV